MVSAFRKKRILLIFAFCGFMCTAVLIWQGLGPNGNTDMLHTVMQIDTLHPDVNVVPSEPDVDLVLPYTDCVPLPACPKPGIFICLHPVSQDVYVSGILKRKQLWEGDLIAQLTVALQEDPKSQLVDLGCNIGEYTLWAAAMGRPVLAVEMLMSNIHLLQTSLSRSHLTPLVTLVNNALYSDHRKLSTTFLRGNMGGSRLNMTSVSEDEKVDFNKEPVTVSTICIDDLIPLLKTKSVYLKMDIENSEHYALVCAHKFFEQVDVKVVQLEWLNRSPQEMAEIKDFMSVHGYVPSSTASRIEPVNIDIPTTASHNVFFLKYNSFKSQDYNSSNKII